MIVEHYVGYSAHPPVACDGNHRQRQLVYQVGVDGNQTLRAAADKHARILLDQIGWMPVMGDKVEIFFFEETIPYAGHHFRVIAIGQYRNQNADRHGTAIPQGPGKKTRLVVEFKRCLANSLPGGFGNGASGDLVQDDRNRRRVELKVSRERLETDGPRRRIDRELAHRVALTSSISNLY